MEKTYTIYKIVEKATQNVVYVGSTCQKLNVRFSIHFAPTSHTAFAGMDKEKYEIIPILENIKTKAFALKIEEICTVACSKKYKLLNVDVANKRSKETKRKIGDAQKGEKNHMYGKPLSDEHKRKLSDAQPKRAVLCVEQNIIYSSSMEAHRQTNINQGNIIEVCKGKRHTAGGYHWKYAV